jgi:RNA polymerase sigma-70 factor (ECF subfamily)
MPIAEAIMPRTPSVLARPAAAAEMPRGARGETDRALAALYADHGGALLRYAMHLTGGNLHSAEDVVQETMLRACQRPWSVIGQPVRAWLFTVARHWVIDQHRAQQARPAEVAEMAELTARAAPDKIDAAITGWDLAAAMAGLHPRDRRLLTAYYLHDDSITKIATDLGVPAGTVKSRLSAARDALRRRLRSETACLPGCAA